MTKTEYPARVGEVNNFTEATAKLRTPLELAALTRDFLERLHQEKAEREAQINQAQAHSAQKVVQQ